MTIKITTTIPTEPSGYCDVATGECVVLEPDAPAGTATPDGGEAPESPAAADATTADPTAQSERHEDG